MSRNSAAHFSFLHQLHAFNSRDAAAEFSFFVRLCRFIAVVEEAAEALAPSNARIALMNFSIDQVVGQALVIAFTAVVDHELCERTTIVTFSHRNQPVQALLLNRADESLRVRMQFGTRNGI